LVNDPELDGFIGNQKLLLLLELLHLSLLHFLQFFLKSETLLNLVENCLLQLPIVMRYLAWIHVAYCLFCDLGLLGLRDLKILVGGTPSSDLMTSGIIVDGIITRYFRGLIYVSNFIDRFFTKSLLVVKYFRCFDLSLGWFYWNTIFLFCFFVHFPSY
jgi:hypothetical protein